MKRKELNNLRAKKTEELLKIVSEKKLNAEQVKMKIFSGKEKNLKVHRNLAREVAKILTLIREKGILEELEMKNSPVKAMENGEKKTEKITKKEVK